MPNNYSPEPFWGEQKPADFYFNGQVENEFSWQSPMGYIPSESDRKFTLLIEGVQQALGRRAIILESTKPLQPAMEQISPITASR